MPSLSKAKLLTDPGEWTQGIEEYVYRGMETRNPDSGAGLGPLPSNTEMVWSDSPTQDSPQESTKTHAEEEVKAREQQAWEKGFQEATARAQENLEKALAAEREHLAAALADFTREREEYFRNVEGDAIRLILAVARKVLHREAQVDPLLLTGVVRVALEKIANGTSLKLRVPAIQADDWRAAVGSLASPDSSIEIVGDKSLRGPECLIVTQTGTTDVSLEGQLAEIEQGFLDLLAQRPEESCRALHSPSYAA